MSSHSLRSLPRVRSMNEVPGWALTTAELRALLCSPPLSPREAGKWLERVQNEVERLRRISNSHLT